MRNTLLLLSLSLSLAAGSARAGTIWSFNFTDDTPIAGHTFNGKLIAGDNLGGTYLITDIIATYGGHAVTLLAPGSPLGNDNVLIDSPLSFTFGGLAFEVPALSNWYSVWVESGTTYLFVAPAGSDLSDPTVGYYAAFLSFDLSRDGGAVPEPSTVALLAGGLALIAWRARRRACTLE